MKKQFMRYKLIADQKVGRANKSEVLNEDLRQVEKHMEHVRIACQSTYKKLSQCMQSHGAGEYEKRLKKLHEANLANGMLEASKGLLNDTDTNHTMGDLLRICSESQMEIAKEKAMYEMFIDDHVITPLQALVETEIPSLYKVRERLKKLVLDRDGALQNWNKAYKSQFTPGVNLQQTTAKADMLKDELDQATSRMEQCKDQLITEMFEFVAKESGHQQRLSDFHAKQLDYHRRCVAALEKSEAEFKSIQDKSVQKTSFGRPLHEHLRLSDREIALPVEACALCVLAFGVREEGIFRIGGGASKLKKFRAVVDGGVLDLAEYEVQDDIHAVAGVLKQYLRELPEPLLTHRLHEQWIQAASISDNDKKLQEIWGLVDQLPPENKANLRYLIKFCAVVAEHQEVNKMNPSNIAMVLAPNLLWSHVDDISKRLMESNLVSNVIEAMITYSDWFFPGELDFAVTPNATSYNVTRTDSVAPTNNTPAAVTSVSPTHSRNSSTDTNLASLESSGPVQAAPSPAGKPRKHKSKAPPPPGSGPPKTHERRRSSPPPDNSAPPTAYSTNSLTRPTPLKRVSTKRPQAPPPQPPKEDVFEAEPPVHEGPTTLPRTKPKPPIRKRQPDSNQEGNGLNLASVAVVSDAPLSPPMPDQPPPPLPDDLDQSMGSALTSELQYSHNSNAYDDDDDADQTTPL